MGVETKETSAVAALAPINSASKDAGKSKKKDERPPLPPCPGRADCIPADELIPADKVVFFPPYTTAADAAYPGSPHVSQLMPSDPEFSDPASPQLPASPSTPARKPPAGQTCGSPLSAPSSWYAPDKTVQEKEMDALKAFAELIERHHPKIDDETTPTGPLPPHCGREQFLIARDLARLRFLRARKLDPVEAVRMYVAAMEWRKAEGVDRILDAPDPAETLFQCMSPHRAHGFDRFGHPIYIESTGRVRVSKLLKRVSEDDIVRRHVRVMEHAVRRCMYSSALNGRNVEKMTIIMDLADLELTVDTSALRLFKRTSAIDANVYAERMFKLFIINAPASFRGVWAIVKPWLDPNTVAKITVVGEKFLPALTEVIDPSQIPKHLGGTCSCSFANGDGCVQQVRKFPDPAAAAGWHKVF